MPILEDGFDLLYWPPLIREAVSITTHPGYRYERFKTYTELDSYFTEEFGSEWRNSEWARYWFNQHAETVRKDKKESSLNANTSYRTRNDTEPIYEVARAILEKSPFLSSRKLTYILNRKGMTIGYVTVSKFIKRFKVESSSKDSKEIFNG